MEPIVKVLILRTAGTNCDLETKYAFEYAGAWVERVHVNELVSQDKNIHDYHILAIPGGFTYGDDIASGKILANELKYILGEELQRFIEEGKLVIGICNGFQILVKAGILPAINSAGQIEATLSLNDSARFEARWVHLRTPHSALRTPHCVWTKGLPEVIYLPVAHGEGKFIPENPDVRQQLWDNGQVVLQYVNSEGKPSGYPDNPNGSIDHIAGICDRSGRIFALMPHPERHLLNIHQPQWTRQRQKKKPEICAGDGAKIFMNGVAYAKEYIC